MGYLADRGNAVLIIGAFGSRGIGFPYYGRFGAFLVFPLGVWSESFRHFLSSLSISAFLARRLQYFCNVSMLYPNADYSLPGDSAGGDCDDRVPGAVWYGIADDRLV